MIGNVLRALAAQLIRAADRLSGKADRDATGSTATAVAANGRAPDSLPASQLVARARRVMHTRRQRDQVFVKHPGLFGEPAFDILMDLFVAGLEARAVGGGDAVVAACVPAATALRWLGLLQQQGLVRREADPVDRRGATVALTPRGMQLMTTYMEQLA